MKGLLIKDLKLIANQKSFFFILLFIAVFMLFTDVDTSFVVSYFTIIASMLVLTTISYDEFDNGNAFLFSLPFTRTTYVKEKYVFALLSGLGAWLFSTLLSSILMMIRHSDVAFMDWFPPYLVFIGLLFFLAAVMIPVQLKYGGERGRIAILLGTGIVVLLGIGIVKLCDALHVDLDALLDSMSSLTFLQLTLGLILICALLLALSYRISCQIVKKKEF